MNTKGTILVVEEPHVSLKLLNNILTAEGYTIHAAGSGELALASVMTSPPALILLDIRAPGIDGYEIFRQLMARSESQHIPVIFFCAAGEVEQWVDALKLGAMEFILKPFQREELLARVQTHLELPQLRAQLEQMVEKGSCELRESQELLRLRKVVNTSRPPWCSGVEPGSLLASLDEVAKSPF